MILLYAYNIFILIIDSILSSLKKYENQKDDVSSVVVLSSSGKSYLKAFLETKLSSAISFVLFSI
jgi:hypothetical protein